MHNLLEHYGIRLEIKKKISLLDTYFIIIQQPYFKRKIELKYASITNWSRCEISSRSDEWIGFEH